MTPIHPAAHALAPAAPKEDSTAEKKFLVTPQNPIVGGDAVPVGIRIASAWLKKNANAALGVTVKLYWNGAPIANFTLRKLALGTPNQDVKFATRIKIPGTTKGKLSVEVIPIGHEASKADESIELEITQCECSASDHGQLVLAAQPAQFTKSQSVAVKSYVPKPVPASRILNRIDCLFNRPDGQPQPPLDSLPDYELIRVDVETTKLLADEVFLAVDFLPSQSGLLEMFWTYNDANTTLQACTYLAQTS
jgi:hypothetical protein